MSVTATAKSSPRCHLLPDFNSIWELVIADFFFDFFFSFYTLQSLNGFGNSCNQIIDNGKCI